MRQALESGPLETTRAAAILRQIGAALEAVHAIGVAHRDLKPENIILQRLSDGAELVKLIDFGIAKVEKSEVASKATTGLVAGSLRYMAPSVIHCFEQAFRFFSPILLVRFARERFFKAIPLSTSKMRHGAH